MEIVKDSSGIIALKGSLTASNIEAIHAQLEPLLDERIHDMVLDLSGVDDIDIPLGPPAPMLDKKERGE